MLSLQLSKTIEKKEDEEEQEQENTYTNIIEYNYKWVHCVCVCGVSEYLKQLQIICSLRIISVDTHSLVAIHMLIATDAHSTMLLSSSLKVGIHVENYIILKCDTMSQANKFIWHKFVLHI